MSISDSSVQNQILNNIEHGTNILSTVGMKIIKQQQSMDEQIINMLIVNQPKQVAPKSENSTVEFVA